MNDADSDDTAEPIVERQRGLVGRVSLVWLLPLAAVVTAVALLWQAYVDRGPLVYVRFDAAGGVRAGETEIRRNDVVIGRVEAVRLADDLDQVIVEARLDPSVERYLDADARFWIVNARLTTTEVSGLGTLLSGAYLEVDWDPRQSEPQTEFVGLEEPPLTKRGTPGLRVTLEAEESGYIEVGSPVFLRQVEVGRVERRRISDDGQLVLLDLFIAAPHHRHVYDSTRFFGVSGVEGSVNADGASVRVESISAFFTGGVAFETSEFASRSDARAGQQQRFRLYDSRRAARESLFEDPADERYRYQAVFEGSIKGLGDDASVEYNGVRVGQVISMRTELPERPGEPARSTVVMQLQPQRFGLDEVDRETFDARLAAFVEDGLRAQLASGNLLTGALLVRLVSRPAAEDSTLDLSSEPFASLPTVPSNVEAVRSDIESLIGKFAALPIDRIAESAVSVVDDIATLVGSKAVQDMPERLSRTLAALADTSGRVATASEDLPTMVRELTRASRNANDVLEGLSPDSEIYIELSDAVRELRLAARSIARFAEVLEENPNAVLTGR